MKIKHNVESELENRASAILTELLTRIPTAKIQQISTEVPSRLIFYPERDAAERQEYRPDIEITVALDGEEDSGSPQTLTSAWKLYIEATTQLNEANFLQRIAAYTFGLTRAVPVLFVRSLSAQTLETCRMLGVCCADTAGNGRIVLGNRAYIERMGNKPLSLERSRSLPLSSPKTENVLRVLLNQIGASQRIWRLQELADEAGVSLGQAARVKDILAEMNVIEARSGSRKVGGFRLSQPEETLQEWAGYVRARSYHAGEDQTFYAIDSPVELQRMLTQKLPSFVTERFALSGLQAAEFYAPYTRTPVFSAYVLPDEILDDNAIEKAMDIDRVTSGVNVVLTVPRDSGVFYLPSDLRESARIARVQDRKVPVVSPIQTYLDLQRLGGRAREAAQYLLEHYLRPRWLKEAVSHD